MILLKDLTNDNVFKVIKLWDHLKDEDKKKVAPNDASIAQAYVNYDIAWTKAIYLDDEPIGFMMVKTQDDDIPAEDQQGYFLWRFMIDRKFQNKGYGKQALDLLMDKCRKDNIKSLYVSCTMFDEMPYKFYLSYGFIDLGFKDGEEQILRLYV